MRNDDFFVSQLRVPRPGPGVALAVTSKQAIMQENARYKTEWRTRRSGNWREASQKRISEVSTYNIRTGQSKGINMIKPHLNKVQFLSLGLLVLIWVAQP